MRAAAKTLVNGVVLGVDGEKLFTGGLGGGHDQFAGGDEDFFVGESDGAAEFDGFVGGFETDDTDGGRDDDFGFGMGADGEHAFSAMMDGGQRDRLIAEAGLQFRGFGSVGDGDKLGAMLLDL